MARMALWGPPTAGSGRYACTRRRAEVPAGEKSIHPREHPACPCVGRIVQRGEAEAAGDPQVETGELVHLLDVRPDRIHPPVATPHEGDEAGPVERLVAAGQPAERPPRPGCRTGGRPRSPRQPRAGVGEQSPGALGGLVRRAGLCAGRPLGRRESCPQDSSHLARAGRTLPTPAPPGALAQSLTDGAILTGQWGDLPALPASGELPCQAYSAVRRSALEDDHGRQGQG
jgi:hypothetical protein